MKKKVQNWRNGLIVRRTALYSFIAYATIIFLFLVINCINEPIDKMGLWQVVIEVVLVPIVVFGFLRTQEEFRASQEKPNLIPSWLGNGEQSIDSEIDKGAFEFSIPEITMNNRGKTMSLYWQIIFILPDEYYFDSIRTKKATGADNAFASVSGTTLRIRASDSPFFPDETLVLPRYIIHNTEKQWDNPLVIRYTVLTDSSPLETGELKLIFSR